MSSRRSPHCLLLLCLPSLLAMGCEDPSPAPDPRVLHLAQWIPFRPKTGGLFFLDRFEAREEDIRLVRPQILGSVESSEPDLPAARLDLFAALEVCRAYWARLPRQNEWRFAVRGSNNWRYPWGDKYTSLLNANTFELRLHKRTRVGTFESGRDPSRDSCYDLIGNVAEWTLSPMAELLLPSKLRERAGQPGGLPVEPLHIGLYHFDLDEVLAAHGLPMSPWIWSWATPFVPEICPALWANELDLCTIGFSYNRFLKQDRDLEDWEEVGALGMSARSYASDLGMRMASDPYTILTALEETEGSPGEQDRTLLAEFLLRFADDFRRVASLRKSLDRKRLGLAPVGAWGRVSLEILGVQQ